MRGGKKKHRPFYVNKIANFCDMDRGLKKCETAYKNGAGKNEDKH